MKLKVTLTLEYKASVGTLEKDIPSNKVRDMVHATLWNAIENNDLDLSGHDDLNNVELFDYLLDVQEVE